jgi:cytochrome o ubiquinol oxidase operon protein cyoD
MSEHITNTEHGAGHTKLKLYVTGFVICLLLTLGAYHLVDNHMLSTFSLFIAVGVLAILQAITQVLCFVRSNTSREDGVWNIIAFFFTVGVIFILIVGSLWIMYNLNYNMS